MLPFIGTKEDRGGRSHSKDRGGHGTITAKKCVNKGKWQEWMRRDWGSLMRSISREKGEEIATLMSSGGAAMADVRAEEEG